ncbi:putative aldouronate transport system permease protein [Anaerocolumna jejuensis DSM 15929]|uniref:Putative aldouronate transport system permease protein n=1 Tax=Anaerocolumna jejuensis DSM 15929 TaxID=1121322 RepID=A0A1M6XS76_9FIRM|nr:carbohydrate ABC transporter permease [Anaerocolumna jejuensis]SHL08665.1 putative aldouronate transport system permease protein [Anaerocolumna jejuensis DSM 15929]
MMEQLYKSKHKKISVLDIFLYIFFTIITFLCIYPFYYLIINTISANDLSANGDIIFLPRQMHLENYKEVFKIPGLGNAAFISFTRTVLGTVLSVLASGFLGFMFTQDKMAGRKFLYRFTILTMYFSAGLIPWYITMNNLNLTNNFLAYIIPGMVSPFNIILVKTYVESTPKSLQEAAEIDGASILTVFRRIMIPLCKPILATVAIFSAVGNWNSFQDTLILVTDDKLYTLQYILYKYINQASSLANLIKSNAGSIGSIIGTAATEQTATSVRMTVSVIVVLPIMLVYPVFQRFFIKGIMIGSVKG